MAEREGQFCECVQGHVPGTAQKLGNVRLGSSDQSGEIGLADMLFFHESRNQLRSLLARDHAPVSTAWIDKHRENRSTVRMPGAGCHAVPEWRGRYQARRPSSWGLLRIEHGIRLRYGACGCFGGARECVCS